MNFRQIIYEDKCVFYNLPSGIDVNPDPFLPWSSRKLTRLPANITIMATHRNTVLKSPAHDNRIWPTSFNWVECFDKRNIRVTRASRIIRRKASVWTASLDMMKTTKYGTTAAPSTQVMKLVRKPLISGVQSILNTSSNKNQVLRISSSIAHMFSSNTRVSV